MARQHRCRRIQPLRYAALIVDGAIGQIGRDLPSGWILARRNRNPRWRTNRRVDIELLESQTFTGKPVYVFRLDRIVTKAREVTPAHVINENKDDVGLRLGSETRSHTKYDCYDQNGGRE